jgi:cysteine synthase A
VPVEMSAEEEALAASTSTSRAPVAPRADEAPAAPPEIDDEARAFVAAALNGEEPGVVMFALEWCEFCWAVRRLFQAMGVAYRSIDLDSVPYQADDWGGRIRRALQARTGVTTIPQVFIGAELIGGATDVIASAESGALVTRLRALPGAPALRPVANPRSFLPGWLPAART